MVQSRSAGYRSVRTACRNALSRVHVPGNRDARPFLRMTEFRVTFACGGKRWTATVAQTEGMRVLPRPTRVFKGDSLAEVDEQVTRYLDDLELRIYCVTHDCELILSEPQRLLRRAARKAIAEAKSAEIRKIRQSYGAITALSGFSLCDISVLLGEDVPALERALSLGRLFGASDNRGATLAQPNQPNPIASLPSSAS
jgi:hypothetical protein